MAEGIAESFVPPERPNIDAAALRELLESQQAWPVEAYERQARIDWFRLFSAWAMVALGFVEALLAFRLGFLLAAANAENGFVDVVYQASRPLVSPFAGIVGSSKLGTNGLFEPSIFVAMLAYFVAALLLVSVIWAWTVTEAARNQRPRAI
jgi:hypothetical protein